MEHQKRAVIYCRVSTEEQSLERQERELRERASRLDLNIVGIFQEKKSGAKSDRKERSKVLALAQKGAIDVILVSELSRWSRSVQDLMLTLNQLSSWKVSILCLSGMELDLTSPQSQLLTTILGAVAEFERNLIRERVKSGLANAKAKGKKLGRQKGVNPVCDKYRDKVLALISQGRSYRWIAKDLQISLTTIVKIVKAQKELESK